MFGWSKRAKPKLVSAPAEEHEREAPKMGETADTTLLSEPRSDDGMILNEDETTREAEGVDAQVKDDCCYVCLVRTAVFRLVLFLLLTLFENVYCLEAFDKQKYSELLVFAVSIAQPVLMSTLTALSRNTETGGDDLLSAVAAETTQTALFAMFCNFEPVATATLLVPYLLQLLLIVLQIREHFPLQDLLAEVCAAASGLVGSVRGACGSVHSMVKTLGDLDERWRAEQALLGFGAVVALLPMLCKEPSAVLGLNTTVNTTVNVTHGEEGALAFTFTESEVSNHIIRFFTGPKFGVATVVMLWALTVLAEDIALQHAGVSQASFLWKGLLLITNYFALSYAIILGVGSLISTLYFVGPMLLWVLPVALPVLFFSATAAFLACVFWTLGELFHAFVNSCRRRHRPVNTAGLNYWFGQFDDQITQEVCGVRLSITGCMVPGLVFFILAILAAYRRVIYNFFFGCGGLSFFWAVLNITFAVRRVNAVLAAHGVSTVVGLVPDTQVGGASKYSV